MKYRLLKFCLFLLLGAIINVAVAIAAFMLVVKPGVPLGFGSYGNANPDAQAVKLWQTHSVDSWPPVPLGGVLTRQAWYDEQSWYSGGIGTIVYSPTTPASVLRETFRGIGEYAVKRVRCGGPLRTLQWESWNGMPQAPAGVFSPNVGNDGLIIGKFLIPRTPLWPGLAINTIFYAAMLWLLLAAPGRLRRFMRLRRGLCPACAYPIGTSNVCTECGKPVNA